MSCPTIDQASKQNFVVNIQDSEFGKLVVRWGERDTCEENTNSGSHESLVKLCPLTLSLILSYKPL